MELGLKETQNRFDQVFQRIINSVCSQEHPLVIFIDDLQWIDSSSLLLLKKIILDIKNPHLLLIGAYATKESIEINSKASVSEMKNYDKLYSVLEEFKKRNIIIEKIKLNNLSLDDVKRFVQESLNADPDYISLLAELIYKKPLAIPFLQPGFLSHFIMKVLYIRAPLKTLFFTY